MLTEEYLTEQRLIVQENHTTCGPLTPSECRSLLNEIGRLKAENKRLAANYPPMEPVPAEHGVEAKFDCTASPANATTIKGGP